MLGALSAVVLIVSGLTLVFADAQARLVAAERIAAHVGALDEAPVPARPPDVVRTILVDSISLDGPIPRDAIVSVDGKGNRSRVENPEAVVIIDEAGYRYVSYGAFGAMGTGSPVPLPRPWIPRLVTGVLAAGLATALAVGVGLALTWNGGGEQERSPLRRHGRRARPVAP